jgi:hypothetical protein
VFTMNRFGLVLAMVFGLALMRGQSARASGLFASMTPAMTASSGYYRVVRYHRVRRITVRYTYRRIVYRRYIVRRYRVYTLN